MDRLQRSAIIKKSLVLPFRFITAFEEIAKLNDGKIVRTVLMALNKAVDIAVNNVPKFEGETLVVLDVSGSMSGKPAVIGSLFSAVLIKSNNADFMVFKNTENSKKALRWLLSVPFKDDKQNGIFYEQTWLSSLPFLFDNVYIILNTGYNIGYWNIFDSDLDSIRFIQFSGYIKGNPEKMFKYQTRYKATDKILDLYKEYDSKILK